MESLVAAAPYLSMIGTAFSVVSGISNSQAQAAQMKAQADAQAQAADYQRQIYERDQMVANQNRQLELQRGQIAEEDARRESRRLLSTIRTSYGASGVQWTGSPLSVMEDASLEQELDASRVGYEGKVRARESQIDAIRAGDQASLAQMERDSAIARGRSGGSSGMWLSAGASLLSGAASAGRMLGTGTQTKG